MSKSKLKVAPSKIDFLEFIKSQGINQFDQLARNVAIAYSDCLPEKVMTNGLERNLRFFDHENTVKASKLEKYLNLIGDYNGFNPKKASENILAIFGPDVDVIIARESSVCIYIKPSSRVWLSRGESVNCDEFSFDSHLGMFRLWWD